MDDPSATFAGRPIQQEEIALILDGKTCEGLPLRTTPSFPLKARTLTALSANAFLVSTRALQENPDCLTGSDQRTQLVRKLASHSVSSQTLGQVFDPDLIELLGSQIARDPNWYLKSGIGGLLRRRLTPKTVCKASEPCPETVLYTEGAFVLYELEHPDHLVAESLRTGNCLGTAMDGHASELSDLPADDIRHLTYWRRIAKGKSRIFSVRLRSGKAVASVEYTVKGAAVSTIEFVEWVQRGQRRIISFLVRGLKQAAVPVRSLHAPRCIRRREALTYRGDWVAFKPGVLDLVIGGWVNVSPDLPLPMLHHILSVRGVHVDIDASCEGLMKGMRGPLKCGSVHCSTAVWPAGITGISCRASFPGLVRAQFPALERVSGVLEMENLVEGHFPKLSKITGVLEAPQMERYTLPMLETIAGILRVPVYCPSGLSRFDAQDLAVEQSLRDFDDAWNAG